MTDDGWRISADDAEEYTRSLGQIMAGGWRQIALAQRLGVAHALGMTTETWVRERIGGYVRMSLDERREAAKALTDPDGDFHLTQRQAAEVLGVSQKTVSRDVQADADDSAGSVSLEDDAPPADADDSDAARSGPVPAAPADEEELAVDAAVEVLEATDDDGGVARARLRVQFSAGMRAARELVLLRPDAVADVVNREQQPSVEAFCADVRAWCEALDAALRRPLRVVGGHDGAR